MTTEAERRLPCRIRLGLPSGGFGKLLDEMQAWLDENYGADAWAMTPAGLRGLVNDAVAVYFLDAVSAAAFVSRWCAGSTAHVSDGAFRVREDQLMPRVAAGLHRAVSRWPVSVVSERVNIPPRKGKPPVASEGWPMTTGGIALGAQPHSNLSTSRRYRRLLPGG
jgi:hypothetical protein